MPRAPTAPAVMQECERRQRPHPTGCGGVEFATFAPGIGAQVHVVAGFREDAQELRQHGGFQSGSHQAQRPILIPRVAKFHIEPKPVLFEDPPAEKGGGSEEGQVARRPGVPELRCQAAPLAPVAAVRVDHETIAEQHVHLGMGLEITADFFERARQVLFVAILIAAEFSVKFEAYHYVQGVVMDIMFSFIHGGFCLVIGEIATGSMRAECKRIMNEKGIPFTDRAVTTVRLKLAFFIMLFIVTIYVAATLVYYNRDNLQAILVFTFMALVAAILMAYMIFYLIYSSLKDIEGAMDDLKSGGSGLIFTKSIDSEFVKVATGISDAARTIKDYQANLEQKIDEVT